MQPDNSSTALKPPSSFKISLALSVIGGLILLIASINFVNLMTARASRRAVEVGVRKMSGAERRNLIAQFLGESLTYAMVSAIIAVVAIELLLPGFNAFLDRGIAFDYVRDATLSGAILGVVVVVGLLAGFYPAFVLSAFRPVDALKSQIKRASAGRVRQALVIVQFAILIGLIISVGVVYRQSLFALNEGLRLDKDQVIVVRTTCQTSFPERVRALPGVCAAACANRNGLSFSTANGAFTREGHEPVTLSNHIIDFGYLELYGFHPVAGRFSSRDFAGDSVGAFDPAKGPVGPNLVINETAARRFGYASPIEAVGQTLGIGVPGFVAKFEIIGVTPDFSFDSVHSPIQPSMYFVGPGAQWLHVKLAGNDLPATLAAIDAAWKESGEPRPITRLFLDQELEKVYLGIKRQSQLFGGFSTVAVFIAVLGLFGLSAFIAEQRTKEIGIRKSMGASSADVLRLLLWQFTKPVLWANLVAWPTAYFVMRRWLDGFAYHVDLSPWMFLAATAAALVIALATVIGHALLVARARPVAALRYE